MLRLTQRSAAGFTLLETTIALAILALAALGTLAAVNHSNIELRQGELRMTKAALADEAMQRQRLAPKSSIPPPGSDKWDKWVPDAYFRVGPDGRFDEVTASADGGIPAETPCSSVERPFMCREIRWSDATPEGGPAMARFSVRIYYDGVYREGTTLSGARSPGLGANDSYSEVFLR